MIQPWLFADDIAHHRSISEDTVDVWMRVTAIPAHPVGLLRNPQTREIDHWERSHSASGTEGLGSSSKDELR